MRAEDGKEETPSLKHNPYAAAADPERYRAVDAPLFTCVAHREACVLCTTAGKNGRNGRTAAVGATVFWLTCPHLNALVARLEGHRCVQAVTEAMKRHPSLTNAHVRSHEAYAARVRQLLTDEQWLFFAEHFLSKDKAQLHKFGNAAVSHARDMKCLHALVAQTLAGAANPVGSLVVNYVLFLHQLTGVAENEAARQEEKRMGLRAALDNTQLFVNFMEAFVACVLNGKGEEERDVQSGTDAPQTVLTVPLPAPQAFETAAAVFSWRLDTSFAALSPDICARALRVLLFLEGKPPRLHKKHRIN
ncbi:hypothetical protein ABB37_03535 [Leptomonas pyrrhocoris]|uniref:Uncharacterized protein n=1 Tax=Leptomonas pyrrhocoris TaxID=157538 RepID=A0A0N0DX18_LEPPY|nr:hypothetical protein ABB37_03535 [Leptomonas pyrrhocoris]XP_015660915.1 hypothetical protein ABB37_03535 [Leptomonas pyrrhocoris]KPA82475.1 hypothetical protein ABB37_03535 [Leptomonas pyrrhocoris]KPA82476.1 hypothetical protein ABB37_03535 [Leptomonas pyrrhocoris]|eukprot:XP_015660914.1 hypothetical protein ABB37_03535 [Leptomonas pyrrhocoris]